MGVPASLARCASLVSLDLSGNQLGVSSDLPESLAAGLVNLRELNVARNRLVSLPNTLGAMRALTRLDCRENQIRALPRAAGGCVSLAELYLGQNQITSLPDEIGDLAALRTLDLARNKLRALPPALAKIPLGLLDASAGRSVHT